MSDIKEEGEHVAMSEEMMAPLQADLRLCPWFTREPALPKGYRVLVNREERLVQHSSASE